MPGRGGIKHTLFTVIAPVMPDEHEVLRAQLENLDYVGRVPSNDVFGFADMEMLHYASMFLYEDPEDGWIFVFENNIDGTIDAYLDRLIDIATKKQSVGTFLLDLYSHCSGFVGDDLPSLKRYMADHIHRPAAAFVAGVGLTRNRIRTDAAIHRVVDQALGIGLPAKSEPEARSAVFEALENDPETRDFTDSTGDSGHKPNLIDHIVTWPVLLLDAIGFVALGVLNLRRERKAKEDYWRPHASLVQAQKAYEDHTSTNHMASIVHLHTDWPRRAAKRAAFRILSGWAKLTAHNGQLGSIESIHFAHWAFVNGRRRLLFVSNYDGSWDSYLDDFTLKANKGLTLAWAHGIGFPRSTFMIKGGAAKGPEFIDWARQSMVPCAVWYNAYPGVSANHIIRNRKLRHALAAAKAGKAGTEWLRHV